MTHSTARLAIAASALVAVGISAPAVGHAESGKYPKTRVEITVYYARNLGLLGPTATSFASFSGPGAAMPILGYPGLARKDQTAPPAPIMTALAGVARVSSGELGAMRAGFALPNGMTIDFGFMSSTFVNGGANPVQAFNVQGWASGGPGGTSFGGTTSTTNLGVTATVPLAAGGLGTPVSTAVNGNMTTIQSWIGNSGLSTIISNQANNQLIQHFQTIDVNISGLKAMVSQQVTQSILSRALDAAQIFRGR